MLGQRTSFAIDVKRFIEHDNELGPQEGISLRASGKGFKDVHDRG
jgi:hypothetical protein